MIRSKPSATGEGEAELVSRLETVNDAIGYAGERIAEAQRKLVEATDAEEAAAGEAPPVHAFGFTGGDDEETTGANNNANGDDDDDNDDNDQVDAGSALTAGLNATQTRWITAAALDSLVKVREREIRAVTAKQRMEVESTTLRETISELSSALTTVEAELQVQ
jgi:hypothetical protein